MLPAGLSRAPVSHSSLCLLRWAFGVASRPSSDSGSVVHPGPLVVKFKVSCAPMSGTRPALAYILHASRPHNCIDGTIMTSSTRESWSKYFYRRPARDLCLLSYSGPTDLSRDLRTANWRLSRESQALFMQVRTMIGAYVSVHFK